MQIGIYVLFDAEHNLRYVGKSVDPVERFRVHKKTRSWVYEYEIIEWTGEDRWSEREKFWILTLRSEGHPLENKTTGGQGPHGLKHAPESIAKMKAAPRAKGRKMSPESIEKSAAKRRGQKFSQESVQRLSDSHKGQTPWNKGKKGLQTAWNKGIPATEEEKQRLRDISLARPPHSDETKEKCRKAVLGREVSDETRAKLRQAWERRRARGN